MPRKSKQNKGGKKTSTMVVRRPSPPVRNNLGAPSGSFAIGSLPGGRGIVVVGSETSSLVATGSESFALTSGSWLGNITSVTIPNTNANWDGTTVSAAPTTYLPIMPRLADLAKGFRQYRFRELSFELIPTQGTMATGVVAMRAAMEAIDNSQLILDVKSMSDFGRSTCSTLFPVATGGRLRVDCSLQKEMRYQTSPSGSASRIVSYESASKYSQVGLSGGQDVFPLTFSVATEGCAQGTSIGLIRIGYRVELFGAE